MRHLCLAFALSATFALAHCVTVPPIQTDGAANDAAIDGSGMDGVSPDAGPPGPLTKVDLLFVVENSNSSRDNESNLLRALAPMLAALGGSTTPPITSIQVGVISTDLGTPGSMVPACADAQVGDDGLLNPIRYGSALLHHEPASVAPPSFGRPTDCTDMNQFPPFIAFESSPDDAGCLPDAACASRTATFAHDAACNVGLYVNGCGFGQPLEATWRALIEHSRFPAPGTTDPNAGFIRPDALLAIVMVADHEDASTRDCNHAHGQPCTDATDVFSSASMAWSNANLALRFEMYQPGGPQDPTWSLDRYIDPSNAANGFLGIKPGHPERVIFAAVTGVPLQIPTLAGGVDWNMLLGAPGTAGPNDYDHRDATRALRTMSAEGPISMRQADLDPNCPERTVPACYREGSTNNPSACTADLQYFARHARRIAEVARRFDQAPLCNGAPCHNSVLSSVCANDYAPAMARVVTLIQSRLSP